MNHFEFVTRTDQKSLFNQIKFLVSCAQESYQDDLVRRRNQLRELIESEEQIYENEFADKIKSRVDKDIQDRKQSLLAMKQQRAKEVQKFVEEKKLHKYMQNCVEIRDELRKKDDHETQLCQLKQMEDKLRSNVSQKKENEFWLNVDKRMADNMNRNKIREDELKRHLQANQCCVLQRQLEEQLRISDMDLEHANKVKTTANLKMKESHRKESAQAQAARLALIEDTKRSLGTITQQRKLLWQEAEIFEKAFHNETMRQVQKEIQESLQSDANLKQSVLDYLMYVRRFNAFQSDQDRKCNELHDEMERRFFCFKNHSKKEMARKKRELAEATHKALLQQICEEQARRMELEALEKENKIIENRFARMEMRDKQNECKNFKKNLDMQLEELARLRIEEQKKFEEKLTQAENDKVFCEKLLEKHRTEGCDYLPPHPNWKLVVFDTNKSHGRGTYN